MGEHYAYWAVLAACIGVPLVDRIFPFFAAIVGRALDGSDALRVETGALLVLAQAASTLLIWRAGVILWNRIAGRRMVRRRLRDWWSSMRSGAATRAERRAIVRIVAQAAKTPFLPRQLHRLAGRRPPSPGIRGLLIDTHADLRTRLFESEQAREAASIAAEARSEEVSCYRRGLPAAFRAPALVDFLISVASLGLAALFLRPPDFASTATATLMAGIGAFAGFRWLRASGLWPLIWGDASVAPTGIIIHGYFFETRFGFDESVVVASNAGLYSLVVIVRKDGACARLLLDDAGLSALLGAWAQRPGAWAPPTARRRTLCEHSSSPQRRGDTE